MKNFLYVLSERTNAVIRVIAMTCVIVMLGTMLLQIFARYGFNAPPVWTEEVARYMMVWSGLLGATMSFKSRTDAVLVDSMWPNSLRLIGNLLQFFAVLCFLLPVLYFCFFNWQGVWGQGYLGRASRLTADTLGFSMVWVSVAVPFAALIILLHAIARWCEPGRSTGINHQD